MTELTTLIFLGPVSVAGGKGNGDWGPVVSVLFILLGCSMLLATWRDYLTYRAARKVPPLKLLAGISALADSFVVDGVWSLLR
jgi:hypothetical protein